MYENIWLSLGPVFCADILQFLCCWWLRCGGCVHKKCWIRSSLPWPHSADTIRQLIRHTAGEDILASSYKHQLKLVNLWSTKLVYVSLLTFWIQNSWFQFDKSRSVWESCGECRDWSVVSSISQSSTGMMSRGAATNQSTEPSTNESEGCKSSQSCEPTLVTHYFRVSTSLEYHQNQWDSWSELETMYWHNILN